MSAPRQHATKHGWVVRHERPHKDKQKSKYGELVIENLSRVYESKAAAEAFLELAKKTYPQAFMAEV